MKKKHCQSNGMTRREFLAAAGAATAGLSVAGVMGSFEKPQAWAQGKERIVIGNIEPLSGPYAESGLAQLQGSELAVKECNAKGGLLGREVVLITEDVPSDPNIGVQKAQKLIKDDKVDFLTGTVTSSVTLAVSDLAQKEKILFMATGSHSDDTTMSHAHRATFRATCSNWMLATALGAWVGKNWNPKTCYHITADYTWGHTARTSLNRALASWSLYGCKELGNDMTPLGTKDFSASLKRARSLKPDLLVLNLYGEDQVHCLKQIKELGLSTDMHVAGPLTDAIIMKAAGEAATGVWTVPWFCKLDTPGSQQLRQALKSSYAKGNEQWEPIFRHYLGYIAHAQLLDAIRRAQSTDVISVVKALEGHKFDGLKWNPSFWREWDHQNIQDVLVVRAQHPTTLKTWADYFVILGRVSGEDCAPTPEEWRKEGGRTLESYDSLKR